MTALGTVLSILQVLDARDPLGTRCKHLEQHIKRNARHKHMLLLINKCDLVRNIHLCALVMQVFLFPIPSVPLCMSCCQCVLSFPYWASSTGWRLLQLHHRSLVAAFKTVFGAWFMLIVLARHCHLTLAVLLLPSQLLHPTV